MKNKPRDLIQLEAQLFEALVSESSFDELVQKASDYMGWPLIVIDPTFRILSHSREEEITDLLWSGHVKRKFCNIDFIVQFNRIPAVVQGIHQSKAFEVPCKFSTYPKLVCMLQQNKKCHGYVICLCQDTPAESDFPALELVAKMLNFKWNRSMRNDLGRFKEDILADLLAGSYQEDPDAKERLRFSDISFPERMYLLAIDISPDSPEGDVAASYFNYSRHLFDKELFVYYQEFVVVFLPEDHLDEVVSALNGGAEGAGVPVGISRLVADLSRCPKAFEEATEALRLGYWAEPKKNIHFFQDIVYYTLLKDLDAETGMELFCHPIIRVLMDYDQNNQSDLCNTLFMFLEYDGSLQKTAQEMYLHRNTVSFRMNKISELVGVDLHEPALRRQILISFQILRFLSRKSGREEDGEPMDLQYAT